MNYNSFNNAEPSQIYIKRVVLSLEEEMIDAPYVLLTIFKLSVVISCFLLNNAHHDFIICRQTYFIISKWVFFVFFVFCIF